MGAIQNIQLTLSCVEKYPAKQHIEAVASKLGVSDGLLYLIGQYGFEIEDSDQPKTWRQRRYFYYCSGVDIPDCCLTYDIETTNLTLYIPEIKPDRVVWVGRGPTIIEAKDQYDVDSVRLNSQLFADLDMWKNSSPNSTFYILHDEQRPVDKPFHKVDSQKLKLAIDLCRVIKDSYEIQRIRRANEISAAAHRAVLQNIRRFTNEAQIEGIFIDVCISNVAKQAYSAIAGSGENAGVLHYTKNDEALKGRQLVCLDAGAEVDCYASDVTRTFPISGSFPSDEAKNIYGIVQKMQESCIAKLKPGAKMLDLHMLAHKIAIEGLLQVGIFHNGTLEEIYENGTSKGFYPHGLGHHVGLEVHDVNDIPLLKYSSGQGCPVLDAANALSPCREDQPPMREGMVITIEPGIYFSRYELERAYLFSTKHSKYINKEVLDRYWAVGGVRIEDDLLITTHGYENLTTAPKGEEAFKIIRDSKFDSWAEFRNNGRGF